jgi:hypothetical protein
MSNSADLLRMLEPVVRPVGAPAPGRSTQRLPLEEKSFEALLAEAQQQDTIGDADEQGVDESEARRPKTNLLSPLSALDAIDNASLRALVGRDSNQTP